MIQIEGNIKKKLYTQYMSDEDERTNATKKKIICKIKWRKYVFGKASSNHKYVEASTKKANAQRHTSNKLTHTSTYTPRMNDNEEETHCVYCTWFQWMISNVHCADISWRHVCNSFSIYFFIDSSILRSENIIRR